MLIFTNAPEYMQGLAQAVNGVFGPGIAGVDGLHEAALAGLQQLAGLLP